ncbi:hypothetical protein ACHAXT_011630 [Thalassiosira profunda]
MAASLALTLLLAVLAASTSCACVLHGTDSGVCTSRYLPASTELESLEAAKDLWTQDMPFCGRFIASYYKPCVPSLPTKEWAAADANFPDGRIISSDARVDAQMIRKKDSWVEESVTSAVQARVEAEKQRGSRHYRGNKDCEEAFARYQCWLNFPRCSDLDESLPMCTSSCENLFRVCGLESDLWRCEEDVIDPEDDYDSFTFFPGQPFVRNEFEPKSNNPVAVCTPSIKGASPPRHGGGSLVLLSFMLALVHASSVAF